LNNFVSKAEITRHVTDTKSEVSVICHECQTEIRLSSEQLQNEQTYRCPQCGTIQDMAALRQAVQDAREGKVPVQRYTSKITTTCPKCHTRIPFSEEQVQSLVTYHCPQCHFTIDMTKVREAIQDAREYGVASGEKHTEKYEFAGVCPRCQTRIPVTEQQLQNEQTYSCPQCGAIHDMAPLRKLVKKGYKGGHNIMQNPLGTGWGKRTTSLSTWAIIIIAIGILIMAFIAIMVLYR
jgi:predicted RNA-binding Zn-ribbon protein involved in translation (DUF1610 family)